MIYIQAAQSAQLNQPIQAEVRIAEQQTWNAAEANVTLTNLALDNTTLGDCGLTMLPTPLFVSPSFVGASLGTFVSRPCTVETLTLHGINIGKGTVTLTNAIVVSNVDQSNITGGVQNAEITITKAQIRRALRK